MSLCLAYCGYHFSLFWFCSHNKKLFLCVLCLWVCLAVSFSLSPCVFVCISHQSKRCSWGKSPLFYFVFNSLFSCRVRSFHHSHSLSMFLCVLLFHSVSSFGGRLCFPVFQDNIFSLFFIFRSFLAFFFCICRFRPFHSFLIYICFSARLSLHLSVSLSTL